MIIVPIRDRNLTPVVNGAIVLLLLRFVSFIYIWRLMIFIYNPPPARHHRDIILEVYFVPVGTRIKNKKDKNIKQKYSYSHSNSYSYSYLGGNNNNK